MTTGFISSATQKFENLLSLILAFFKARPHSTYRSNDNDRVSHRVKDLEDRPLHFCRLLNESSGVLDRLPASWW